MAVTARNRTSGANMTDPTQAGEPTEEEIRAYLAQIREADPAAIVVQAYRMLGEGAELKLGRADARVLIDAMAAVAEAVSGQVQGELVEQMRQGVAQLQSAQVQAESQQPSDAAQASPAGQAPPAGTQDPSGAAGGPSTGAGAPRQPPGPGSQQTGDEQLTNRLWIPGRGPKPGM
jgi:hypothetical protein